MTATTTRVDGIDGKVNIEPVYPNLSPQEETRWVSVEGGELFCHSFGNHGPAVIVISGGPGLPHDYLLELSALGLHQRVIFFDPRCCGQSTGEINDLKMNMKTFIEDIDAVRQAYKLGKASFIGHSSGGLMVMRYAIEYSNFVEKMILLNSMDAFYSHIPEQDYIKGIRNIKASPGFKNDQVEEIVKSYKDFFGPAFYKPESIDKLNLKMSLKAAKNSIEVREAFERTLFEPSFDYQRELSELAIQTLIMHSTNDFIPHSVSENLHRILPNSKKPIDIEECGHFSVTEQIDIVCKHISTFLQSR